MYDADRAKQLEKQSHVRGAFSKQFFSGQQSQLQNKRRQMKRILDQQVQQKRRTKQRQKQQAQKKQRRQQQQIKKYYEDVISRERRLSENSSNVYNQKNNSNGTNFYDQNQSLVKKHIQQNTKPRTHSNAAIQKIQNGDIHLMPVMAMSGGQLNQNSYNYASNSSLNNNHNKGYNYYDNQNAGNIPLLDLSEQTNFLKNKKKSKTRLKKQKTERQNNSFGQGVASSNVKFIDSRNNYQQTQGHLLNAHLSSSIQSNKNKQRRRTMSDQQNGGFNQQNVINSRVSRGSKFQENSLSRFPHQKIINRSPSSTKRNTELEIPEQIQQMQTQNKALKSELKKSQKAISLLIGAVRSNPKLDKFRVQAQKILHTSQKQGKVISHKQNKINEKGEQSPVLLPKLKVKHQSIMHDYLLQAAKKGRMRNLKSQTSKQ